MKQPGEINCHDHFLPLGGSEDLFSLLQGGGLCLLFTLLFGLMEEEEEEKQKDGGRE